MFCSHIIVTVLMSLSLASALPLISDREAHLPVLVPSNDTIEGAMPSSPDTIFSKRSPASHSSANYERHLESAAQEVGDFDGNDSSDGGDNDSALSDAQRAAVEAAQARRNYVVGRRLLRKSLSQIIENAGFREELALRRAQNEEWDQMPAYAHDRQSYAREERRASLAAPQLIQRVGSGESLSMHGCVDETANGLVTQFNDQIARLRSLIRDRRGGRSSYFGGQLQGNINDMITTLAWQASFTKQQLHVWYARASREVSGPGRP